MSNFFIHRPNFAWVVAIFISLAGLLAIPSLPVSQFPEVAPPQIAIYATYPGASAEVLVDSVTSVIEEELNGAEDLLYYESSSSSNGIAQITVTFAPGADSDMAQVDVQNRLKRAEARLPQSVLQQGVQVEKASANFLLLYTLRYKDGVENQNTVALSDYAARNINNELRRVSGVGRLQFFGAEAAMRVWLDSQKLLGYGLSVADVRRAIEQQNIQVPAGSFGARPADPQQELTATLAVQGMMSTPEEFGSIILHAREDGSAVHLRDVARMEIGPEDYNFAVRVNGELATGGAIQLAPGANALETAEAVKLRLEELSTSFPVDIEYVIPYDTSTFVGVAIEKVVYTLLEAIVLVFLVMYLFLQNFRYTFIPTLVVPVCLLGTFAIMSAIGFSINMMTMFGMVLAIGILVDDAIVVVENVERIMAEEGLAPLEATIKAMRQVGGAIVGITLVLSAVFFPLAFMSGSVGVIYRQFSVSLAVSILFSGFLALTFTPALCATFLKPIPKGHHAGKKGFFGWFNRKFSGLTNRYTSLSNRVVRRTGRFMMIYLVIIGVLALLYVRVPESFVPIEDQGYLIADVQLPPGATYSRTLDAVNDIEEYLLPRDTLQDMVSIMGYSFSGMGQNAALIFGTFIDWSERGKGESAMDETDALNARFSSVMDGQVLAVTPPPITGLGNSGGFALRLQDRGGVGRDALVAARDDLLGQANASPVLAYAAIEGLDDAPELRLDIDRDKAQALGVSFDSIGNAISSAYGSAVINDFVNEGRTQRVVIQSDIKDRMTPESIAELRVPNEHGQLVPLTSFMTPQWQISPVQISRYNGYPAFKVMGEAAPGYSSGQAMAEIERIAATLSPGIGYEWTGLSYQEKVAGAQAVALFALAILVVFLLLVALYESWSIPFSVMLIVPIGALGSVLAVVITGMSNDVYFKVGLITVIGLAAKNAILIVEFAKDLYNEGRSVTEAAVEAAKLRFRPIIMTSLAFILGVTPLAIATGAGAASQRALGTGVIGGMVAATTLGVVFIPIFYAWVMSMVSRRRRRKHVAVSADQAAPEN